ncbi:MAG: DNA recombination protein RmuC [Alphaproteobacteria bacterium]|nr:DNA recombination protein RmuC [Alphaproteobacteria bacterium]
MELSPWMVPAAITAAVVVLVVLLIAVLVATAKVARLRDMFIELGAAQEVVHNTVRERLNELGSRVGERLNDLGTRVGEGLGRSEKTIGEIRERLAVIDAAQKNLTELSSQVVSLQDILSNKQARGAFGEVQLKDLVEAVLPPSAYSFQKTLANGMRCDCIILLPNPPGPIAIDAKFPLESYQALRNAKDEVARVEAQRNFTRDVRTHIADIAEKYIVPNETAESALLFLPSEAIYAELHANFRNCVEESFRRRVYIVSPSTLWATLNTVRAILRDVRMREQAAGIQREVLVLLEDMQRLNDRINKVGANFETTTRSFGEVRTSLDKIQRRAEKIREVDLALDETQPSAVEQRTPTLFPRQ